MKFMKLLTSAYVGGVLRHPHEGAIPTSDEDAQRLLDDKAAEDVTGDFSAKQLKEATVEPVSAATPLPDPALTPVPHQSEVAPQATEAPTPADGASPAAPQE